MYQQMRPSYQSRQMRPSFQSGQMRPTSQSGQMHPASQTGQMRPSSQTGQMRSSSQTGQIRPSSQTGQIRPSSQTGQIRPSSQTGQIRPSSQTGQMRPSSQAGQMRPPSQTGQMRPPSQTGQMRPPSQSGQMRQMPQSQSSNNSFPYKSSNSYQYNEQKMYSQYSNYSNYSDDAGKGRGGPGQEFDTFTGNEEDEGTDMQYSGMPTRSSSTLESNNTKPMMAESVDDSEIEPNPRQSDLNKEVLDTEDKEETTGQEKDDSVNKATANNMGTPPPKKPRVTLHCDLCKLEFSSQIPLDMHLKGSKHAKKLRSLEILNGLKEKGQDIQEGTSSSLQCEICNVIGNSTQQLQMHLAGSKHKSKCRSLGIDPNLYQKPPPAVSGGDGTGSGGGGDGSGSGGDGGGGGEEEEDKSTPQEGEKSLKRPYDELKTEEDSSNPGEMSEQGSAAKFGKFYCQTCNVSLNSEIQLQQHMTSKKHKDKLEGKKPAPKRWWRKKKPAKGLGNGDTPAVATSDLNTPIDETFVPGEIMQ